MTTITTSIKWKSNEYRDRTGKHGQDLVGNRIKRFFTEQRGLVRDSCDRLPRASALPNQAKRADFVRAGCPLIETPDTANDFPVQTGAHDTGAIGTVLTALLFVKHQRWGAVRIGWNADGSR